MKANTLSVDTDVNIPAAVKMAAARAEALSQQIYGANEETPTNEDTPAELQADALTQQGNTEQPTPAPEKVTQQGNDDESWEHKYKSMKGRHDRAQEQIKAMADQITDLQNLMARMQTTASTSVEQRPERLITEEEERDYGPDFLKVVGKKAKEELSPEVFALKKQVADLEAKLQSVGGHVAQDARTRMLSTLDDRLPAWRDINYSEDFKSWLQLPDTYSGVIRHELLKAAYERNDSPRVLAFFNGFLAEEAAVAPAEQGPDLGTTVVPKVPLQELAAPGRAKTGAATGAPAEKPFFTRAQITQFYADSAAGKYKGRDADRERIEKQIFEATREGRLR